MSYSSQAGQVVFRTQTTPGTYNSDVGTAGMAMKLRSGSLGPQRSLLTTDPEIGGGRDVNDAYLGAVAFAGDYSFYVRLAALNTLLRAFFGTASAATASGLTTQTITPSDSSILPYLSIEEQIGGGLDVFNYTDAVVNTLHLEAAADGYLMGTAGLIARLQTDGNTASSAAPDDVTNLIVGTNISITYNAVTVPAKSFKIDFTNNFENNDFRMGSLYLGDLGGKRREATGSVLLRHQSAAAFKQATYGTSSLTAPGGLTTKQQLVITCSTYEDAVGAGAGVKNQLIITIPKVAYEPFAFAPNGDDLLENEVSFRALRPALGTPLCTILVKTGVALIA